MTKIKTYRSILKSLGKSKSRFDSKKNYSSFWMDEGDWYSRSSDRFAGLSGTNKTNDTVKAIKLNTYQRAIANFVNILTKKNIPVVFEGDTSYTNGESVVISTDIKDNTFDVSVGLALHEASHIILTDFQYLKGAWEAVKGNSDEPRFAHLKMNRDHFDLWKNLLNWIEDRRIDNYVFTTSPGYRAYYHKMYDHYWNDKMITKGLLSKNYRDPKEVESYMFRIINSLNPASDVNALPGLSDIIAHIDVKNIARLKTVDEAGTVAYDVMQVILRHVVNAKIAGTGPSDGGEELSAADQHALEKALQKQKEFLKGELVKKPGSKALNKRLKQVKNSSVDLQMVGVSDGDLEQACLIYDVSGKDPSISKAVDYSAALSEIEASNLSSDAKYKQRIELSKNTTGLQLPPCMTWAASWDRKDHEAAIQAGLDMGGLLGKKLQLRDEERELVLNRLRTGKVDNKRLSQAGFGIETVFKQTMVSKHRKANLHISLDASGSMSGSRWNNAMKMCIAIAKAATYVHNLDIQVTLRGTTDGDIPAVIYIYNSKHNNLNHLISCFRLSVPSSFTPEGLCFEAMIKRGMMIPGSKDVDSYFLNLSDGEPTGCKAYNGVAAWNHTKKQMQYLKEKLNIGVLSFFMHSYGSSEALDRTTGGKAFKHMYGSDARDISADEAITIAKTLNQKFLQHASMQ